MRSLAEFGRCTLPSQSPNVHAYIERFMRSMKARTQQKPTFSVEKGWEECSSTTIATQRNIFSTEDN